jgi:hypothetical protein
MADAVMASQTFVRISELPGVCNCRKDWAREFWADIVFVF